MTSASGLAGRPRDARARCATPRTDDTDCGDPGSNCASGIRGVMMRIAVFSYGLPVKGQKRGGIERAAHTLAQGLAERGHQVVVFTHDPRPDGAAYEVRELPWKRFVSDMARAARDDGLPGNVLALLPDYSEFDVDVAHGDSLLLPLRGKPIVRVMHGTALEEALHATSHRSFRAAVRRVCSGTADGPDCAEHRGGQPEHTPHESFHPTTSSPTALMRVIFYPARGERSRLPSLVFVGTLDGRKRGRFLLDVFSRSCAARLSGCGTDVCRTTRALTCLA